MRHSHAACFIIPCAESRTTYIFLCVCAGQVMTAGVAEILNGYSLKAVLRRVPGEKHTTAAEDTHDDSYLGNARTQNRPLRSDS